MTNETLNTMTTEEIMEISKEAIEWLLDQTHEKYLLEIEANPDGTVARNTALWHSALAKYRESRPMPNVSPLAPPDDEDDEEDVPPSNRFMASARCERRTVGAPRNRVCGNR